MPGHYLQRLKIRQLDLLVAINDHRSLRAAADIVGLSQPAVTKTLKLMEEDLGLTLFDRTNRGVSPTEYGVILVRHARSILAQLRQAGDELADLTGGIGGRVVLGTLLTASESIIPAAIISLRQQRPGVTVKIVTGTNDVLMPALIQGDIDLVVGRLPEFRYRSGIQQEALYDEDVVCVVRSGHPLLKKGQLSLSMVQSEEWILPPQQTTLRRQIDRAFLGSGLEPPFCSVESVALLANRALLKASDAIGIGPSNMYQEDIETGSLTALPLTLNISKSPVGVSIRSDHPLSPTARAFLEELKVASGVAMRAAESSEA
ncbi:MAG: LysR family transcriptional regulator [Alphaproteobacteria bacterium]|jgi:DNA-binding transcriptional LysR family regulator|nr:LysR family transcriptional regulator [Alphaproteobacteria bacterium]MBT4086017.1 LysR family transcriptional regulator [Alphaproteobacteria bacterium]MBT4546567.1 LysR family transcriptional regulator [Alphaproteobacteria bacterium]MBT7745954.1 LysR family transcriptional regulator [Alphaproteobacteria bacterium]